MRHQVYQYLWFFLIWETVCIRAPQLKDFSKKKTKQQTTIVFLSLSGIQNLIVPKFELEPSTDATDISLTVNIIKHLYLTTLEKYSKNIPLCKKSLQWKMTWFHKITYSHTFARSLNQDKRLDSAESSCAEYKAGNHCPHFPLPSPSATLWQLLWVSHYRFSLLQRAAGLCNLKSGGQAE